MDALPTHALHPQLGPPSLPVRGRRGTVRLDKTMRALWRSAAATATAAAAAVRRFATAAMQMPTTGIRGMASGVVRGLRNRARARATAVAEAQLDSDLKACYLATTAGGATAPSAHADTAAAPPVATKPPPLEPAPGAVPVATAPAQAAAQAAAPAVVAAPPPARVPSLVSARACTSTKTALGNRFRFHLPVIANDCTTATPALSTTAATGPTTPPVQLLLSMQKHPMGAPHLAQPNVRHHALAPLTAPPRRSVPRKSLEFVL